MMKTGPNAMKLLSPNPAWRDYEMIDSGGCEKLERFGMRVVRRPEPQALWERSLSEGEWKRLAHASFVRKPGQFNDDRGEWRPEPGVPARWKIAYASGDLKFTMRLGLTSFKHVGIFPEQAPNWDYIYSKTRAAPSERPKVLNLFAYTGSASLAACAAGAETVHVDSVRQVISWARENMELSGLSGIRWILDDAVKFVEREIRRRSQYDGIILDPPAFGHGPGGERWVLEQNIAGLIRSCAMLLKPSGSFLVLNLYSLGLSSMIAENLLNACFGSPKNMECGELFIPDRFNRKMPLGVFARFCR